MQIRRCVCFVFWRNGKIVNLISSKAWLLLNLIAFYVDELLLSEKNKQTHACRTLNTQAAKTPLTQSLAVLISVESLFFQSEPTEWTEGSLSQQKLANFLLH